MMKPDKNADHNQDSNLGPKTNDGDQSPHPSDLPVDASADPEKGLESQLHQNQRQVRPITGFNVSKSSTMVKPVGGRNLMLMRLPA